MSAGTAVVLLILVISIALPIATTSAPFIDLDSFLTQQLRLDPQATNDSFLSLPTSLKKSLSHSTPLSHKTQTLVSSIISLSVSHSLNVCLIGNSYLWLAEPSLLHTTTIVVKCTLKLVDEYKHMLCQATEPLSTFLEYITIAIVAVAQNMRELYRLVLLDTLLAPYFS